MNRARISATILIACLLVALLAYNANAVVGSEVEPNNSVATANDILPSLQIRGAIDKPGDEDYFAFELLTARQMEITIKQWAYKLNVVVTNCTTNKVCYAKVQDQALGSASSTMVIKPKLPPGKYVIILSSKNAKKRGRYEIGIQDLNPVEVGVVLPKAKSIERGKTLQLKPTPNPSYFPTPKVSWRSSKSSVASVAKDGTVKAKSYGMAFIAATTPDGQRALCRIMVVKKKKT